MSGQLTMGLSGLALLLGLLAVVFDVQGKWLRWRASRARTRTQEQARRRRILRQYEDGDWWRRS